MAEQGKRGPGTKRSVAARPNARAKPKNAGAQSNGRARPKAGAKAGRRGGGAKGRRGFAFWLPRALIGFFVVTLAWVGLYRFVAPPTTFYILGQAARGYEIERRWVPITRISPHVVRAVVGAEDHKFCSHWGFDLVAMREAVFEAQNGAPIRGASTISQQAAKNAFLWHGRGIVGAVRKVSEMYFTALMELFWPKSRIMEVYLNVAEFGPGVFGVEAAAGAYFGKTARTLSPREAALLAAVLPSPKKWSAASPGPYVARRAAMLERRAWTVKRQGLAQCVRGAE